MRSGLSECVCGERHCEGDERDSGEDHSELNQTRDDELAERLSERLVDWALRLGDIDAPPRCRPYGRSQASERLRAKRRREHEHEFGRERLVWCELVDVHEICIGISFAVPGGFPLPRAAPVSSIDK